MAHRSDSALAYPPIPTLRLYPEADLPELAQPEGVVFSGGDNRPQPDIAPVEPVLSELPEPSREQKPKLLPVTITERKISAYAETVTVSTLRVTSGCTAGWLSRSAGGWAKLRHPNIAAIYRIEDWHGLIRIHSEHVAGPDLHEFLQGLTDKKYPLTDLEFRALVVGLLSAISHAHARKAVHGALAADCVVLTDGGSVKLLRYSSEHLTAIAGPGRQMQPLWLLAYQAPEQFHGVTIAASDIYAIGMLLYHAAIGRLPRQVDDPGWMIGRVVDRAVNLRGIPKSYPRRFPK